MMYEDGSDTIVFITDKDSINWINTKVFNEVIEFNYLSEMKAYKNLVRNWEIPLSTLGEETIASDPYARLDKISENLLYFVYGLDPNEITPEEARELKYTVLLKVENESLVPAQEVLEELITTLDLEKSISDLITDLIDYGVFDSPDISNPVALDDRKYTTIKNIGKLSAAESDRVFYFVDRKDKFQDLQKHFDDLSINDLFKKSKIKECFIPILTGDDLSFAPEALDQHFELKESGSIVYNGPNKKIILRKYNNIQLIKLKSR